MAANVPEAPRNDDIVKDDLGGMENVCKAMLRVADEVEALNKRIHHLATDLRGESEFLNSFSMSMVW